MAAASGRPPSLGAFVADFGRTLGPALFSASSGGAKGTVATLRQGQRVWYNREMVTERKRLWGFSGGMICLLAVVLAALPCAAGNDMLRAAGDLRTKYAADIEQLAKWCEANGLADEAQKTRHVLGAQRSVQALSCPCCPTRSGPPNCPPTPRRRSWSGTRGCRSCGRDQRQGAVRNGAARRADRPGGPGLRVGHGRDPGQSRLRARAAAVRLPESSATNGARSTRRRNCAAGYVWSDKFGWLPKAHLAPLRGGTAILRRPLDFGRRRRRAASRHPLRLGHGDRTLHDPHEPQHRGGAWRWA